MTRKYGKDDVVLLSVSADFDGKEWRSIYCAKENGLGPVLGRGYNDTPALRRAVFPTYIIIDRDGVIRDRIMGMNDKESVVHRLKQTLQTLTPEKGS